MNESLSGQCDSCDVISWREDVSLVRVVGTTETPVFHVVQLIDVSLRRLMCELNVFFTHVKDTV